MKLNIKQKLIEFSYLLFFFLKEPFVIIKELLVRIFIFLNEDMWDYKNATLLIFCLFIFSAIFEKNLRLSLYLFIIMLIIRFLKVRKDGHWRKSYKDKYVYKKFQ